MRVLGIELLAITLMTGCGMKGKLRPGEKDEYPRSYPETTNDINKKK